MSRSAIDVSKNNRPNYHHCGAQVECAIEREHQPREYLADKMIFTLSSLFYNDGRLSLILVSGLRKIKSLPILWAQDRLS